MQSKYSNMNGCCAFFNGRSGLECQWELPANRKAAKGTLLPDSLKT
jgi:hypothetical protein